MGQKSLRCPHCNTSQVQSPELSAQAGLTTFICLKDGCGQKFILDPQGRPLRLLPVKFQRMFPVGLLDVRGSLRANVAKP